jgi:hypothetical protein
MGCLPSRVGISASEDLFTRRQKWPERPLPIVYVVKQSSRYGLYHYMSGHNKAMYAISLAVAVAEKRNACSECYDSS